ncbi:MAG: hypothetical protein LBG17_09200 [Bacteroidales bacterium]|jgi:predicted XRE-type DNA-binding protein|nr:hypothetical protein [Bacteroidales bacterium]
MKKNLFIGFVLLMTFSISAQKIKVKKGNVMIDGASVAKIISQRGANLYTFSDLNDNVFFTVSEEKKTASNIPLPKNMLVLTGTNGNIREISTKGIKWSVTFNMNYYISQLIINSGLDLLTSQGFNQDKISDFFKISKRDVSDAMDERIAEAKTNMAKEDELAESVNLIVDKNGNIFAKGKRIGKVSVTEDKSQILTTYLYNIVELNNISVASTRVGMSSSLQFHDINTYDRKKFTFFAEEGRNLTIDKDNIAKRIVRKLYYENYKLGDMLLAKSRNIYGDKGYVIDKNGNKIEGFITLEFMPKYVVYDRSKDFDFNPDKYGQSVLVTVGDSLNDPNAKELKYFASDGVRIVVEDVQFFGVPGKTTILKSAYKVAEKAVEKAVENAKSFNMSGINVVTAALLGLNTPYFYKIMYEKDGNLVLDEHKFETVNVKLKGKKTVKLYYTNTINAKKKQETIKEEFDGYVNCPALIYSDYNTETVDGLIKLVDDYVEKCER